MKRKALVKTIEGFGCVLVRHGGKHQKRRHGEKLRITSYELQVTNYEIAFAVGE